MPTFTREQSERMERAALALVDLGMAVFPLEPCGKRPIRGSRGFEDATTDPERVRGWWRNAWEVAEAVPNIGVACGRPSGGLVAIDIDVHGETDGHDAVWSWEHEHGALPETASTTTGSGGEHMLYRAGGEVRPSVNGDLGVDVRADGSYIVAPPSVHPNGQEYTWQAAPDEVPIAPADGNVRAFIEHVRPSGFGASVGGQGHPLESRGPIAEGGRNDALYSKAAAMRSKSLPFEVAMDAMRGINRRECVPPLPEREVEEVVRSAYTKPEGHSKEWDDTHAPANGLRLGKNGLPISAIDNVQLVLERDGETAGRIWYDECTYQVKVDLPLPWDGGKGTRPIRDADYTQVQSWTNRKYGIGRQSDVAGAIANIADDHRRNSLREMLERVERDNPEDPADETDYIATLLPLYLGAEGILPGQSDAQRAEAEYNAAAMHVWMRGAVARAMEPGCKFDYMIVLVGAQGIGKSTLLSLLAMDTDYFTDNLNTISGDAAFEKLRGMWICEVGELLAFKKSKEVEAVKAFVTSRWDNFREKYGRVTSAHPRTCVFAGSTNSTSFLTDATGNRRFLPIACRATSISPALNDQGARVMVERAWAQAVREWRAGMPLAPLRDMEAYAAMTRSQYEEDDVRLGLIQHYLDGLPAERLASPGEPRGRVCAAEIINEVLEHDELRQDGNPPRRLINEVHEIMGTRIVGWAKCPEKKRTLNYGVQRCYVYAGGVQECDRKVADYVSAHGE